MINGAVFKNADLYGANFYKANLTNVDFTGANLQFINIDGSTITDGNFTSADLRDISTYQRANIINPITKNTIMQTGSIQTNGVDGVSLKTADDFIRIRKSSVNAILSAASNIVSGGAKLIMEEGAVLKMDMGYSRLDFKDSTLELHLDKNGVFTGMIDVIYSTIKVTTTADTKLDIILSDDFIIYTGATLDTSSAGVVTSQIEAEQLSVERKNGELIAADSYVWDKNTGLLTFTIPEPATYASLFAALALGFAAYRKRK